MAFHFPRIPSAPSPEALRQQALGLLTGSAPPVGRIGVIWAHAPLAAGPRAEFAAAGWQISKSVRVDPDAPVALRCIELLDLLDQDLATDAVLILDDLDEDSERACDGWVRHHMDKPVLRLAEAPAGRSCASPLDQGPATLRCLRRSASASETAAWLNTQIGDRWLPFD